jgi:antagonist of KipI
VLAWKADIASLYSNQKTIRICSGEAYNSLADSSKKHFATSSFTITNQSDRKGYRLKGESLELLQRVDLISSAVTKGTIQLLPNGQMIILMADHQTTGGYLVIAHVISADIPSLAQRQPNETIQFQFIDHSEAEEILWQQHQYLQVLQNACTLQLTKFLEEHHVH